MNTQTDTDLPLTGSMIRCVEGIRHFAYNPIPQTNFIFENFGGVFYGSVRGLEQSRLILEAWLSEIPVDVIYREPEVKFVEKFYYEQARKVWVTTVRKLKNNEQSR